MKLYPAKCSFEIGFGQFLGFIVTKKWNRGKLKPIGKVVKISISEKKKRIFNI